MSITRATTASGMRRAATLDGSPRRMPGFLGFMVVPLIAVLIVVDAVNGGGSPPTVRSVAAILVWWTILMAFAFLGGPRARVRPAALACAGLLLVFALLAGLSVA